MYLDPGTTGINQFHIIFSGSEADLTAVKPLVVARVVGGAPQNLRQLRCLSRPLHRLRVVATGSVDVPRRGHVRRHARIVRLQSVATLSKHQDNVVEPPGWVQSPFQQPRMTSATACATASELVGGCPN